MTNQEILEKYLNISSELETLVNDLDEEILQFCPFDDAWTIHEHVVHLLDDSFHVYIRYRKAIAQASSSVETYDEMMWHDRLNYLSMNTSDAMTMIHMIRKTAYMHLASIVNDDWNKYSIQHPERGNITLPDLITRNIEHVRTHIDMIKRNVRLRAENPRRINI